MRLALTSALMTGIVFASNAFAEGPIIVPEPASGSQIEFNLKAQVSGTCGVYSVANASSTSSFTVDFGDLGTISSNTTVFGAVPDGGNGIQLSYICNNPGGFSRKIKSANSGYMFRKTTPGGAGDQIAYEMAHTGDHNLGFDYRQLTAELNDSYTDVAFLNGETGSVSFRTKGVLVTGNVDDDPAPYTSAYAGDYADTVTISVTAN